ncbi:MAG: molybdopterin-dependent oxidoreductase [Chloroflexi bacterium]|nr:molybdopterin-dependent oxidoreductase [Chloroflexota bacterium]
MNTKLTTIRLTINGSPTIAEVPGDLTLLRFLRDELHLTGTKNGCSQGDCWACTVLIDGVPTRACLTKASCLDGKTIQTIESLARDGTLHPLQRAFVDYGAVQCGFCTPGMIVHAKSLLDRNPSPSAEEIVSSMGDHLCRCTGYVSIVEAVQSAARVLRGARAPEDDSYRGKAYGEQILGAPIHDKDGAARVTGQLKFADDLYFEGMLWGKILFAGLPHAEILSIDTSEAEAMAGVRAVLTAGDVRGPNLLGQFPPDRPVLCKDKVRLLGDMVAAVFADTLKQAERAVRKIRVEYRPLEVISSPQRALESDAPLIHARGNLLKHATIRRGDIANAFGASNVIVEGHYETQFVEHAYLEPEAGVARPTPDGGVEVYFPTQMPFNARAAIARNLALPEEKVRLISTPLGGGFGGKIDITLEVLLALGALRTGRPVKMTLTRAESLRTSGKRHPYSMDYKIGARKDGRLMALQARVVEDAGGYAGLSAAILEQALVFAGGPYRWASVLVEGYAANTNNPSGTAFRGFGINQVNFALESTLDELARKLGMDPIELRLKNALRNGNLTITGEKLKRGVAIGAVLREARKALAEMRPIRSDKRIGIGVAAGHKNIASGRGEVNTGGAIVELLENGELLVRSSAVDMGQGTRTVLGQIAAAATGVAYDRIGIITGDTGLVPPGSGAVAQRQTVVHGNAVLRAASKFREALQTYVAQQCGIAAERVGIAGDYVVDTGAGGRVLLSLDELARLTASEGEVLRAEARYDGPRTYPIKGDEESVYVKFRGATFDAPKDDYRNYIDYNYQAQVAVVEVDEATGEVRLRRIISSHEVGRALNRQKIKGQLEGAAVMGMGYALSEEFVVVNGLYRTVTLKKCGVPSMRQTPVVVLRIVEDPTSEGPFGAKAVSEVAMVPTAAAIANAIYDAVGVRVTTLPATREKVLRGLSRSG